MRSKLILAMVAGLLFCALATLEFPELMHLTDDVSNDFTMLHSPQPVNSPSSVRPTVPDVQLTLPGYIAVAFSRINPSFIAHFSPRSSMDILHFFCVRRT
jgi:hypothetical protein